MGFARKKNDQLGEIANRLAQIEARLGHLEHLYHERERTLTSELSALKNAVRELGVEPPLPWHVALDTVENKPSTIDSEYIREYWETLAQSDYKHTTIAGFVDNDDAFLQTAEGFLDKLNLKYELFDNTSSVLDLGCGPGRFAHSLEGKVGSYLGIDVSPKMLSIAKSNVSDPKFNFKQSDGTCISFVEDDSIDFAFSFLVLQHMPRAIMFDHLKELARVVKPMGKLAFQLPYPGGYACSREEEHQLWLAESYPSDEIIHFMGNEHFALLDYYTESHMGEGPSDQYFVMQHK